MALCRTGGPLAGRAGGGGGAGGFSDTSFLLTSKTPDCQYLEPAEKIF